MWTYNPRTEMYINNIFALIWSKHTLDLFRKKRYLLIVNFKNMRFYKLRSKLFLSKTKTLWIPLMLWINEHFFVFVHKCNNIEFDMRIMKGMYIYNAHFVNFSDLLEKMDISFYMSRSYNWKYLT